MKNTTELERAVLGALLNRPEHAESCLALLSTADFTDVKRAQIWAAIEAAHYAGNPVDPITIGDATDELALSAELAYSAPAANNAPVYAAQLAEHGRARRQAAELRRALSRLEEGEYGSIVELQAALEALSERKGGADATFSEALSRSLELVEHTRSAAGSGQIAFGLPALDERLPVLANRGLLLVVAARPSVGKTALANQLSLRTAEAGLPVGKIELEMSIEEMALRSIAAEYRINNSALAAGDEDALDRLTAAVQERNIRDLPIFLDDSSYSLAEVTSRISEWHRKHKIAAVTVDHLGLIAHKAENRNHTLGEITRALKLLAKRLEMPIVLLSQLARLNERENRRPKLSDLRDSGAIEQDADIVIAIHSDGLDADDNGIRMVDIGLLKNRGGRTGWLPRSYAFDGRYQTFTEHALQLPASAQGGAGTESRGSARAHRSFGARAVGAPGFSEGKVWSAAQVPGTAGRDDW